MAKLLDIPLNNVTVVYARKCTVNEVPEEIAREFVDLNHKQGVTSDKTKSLGLYLKDELIAVIMVCYPRTKKMKLEYSREILRLCFKEGYRIPGGASKLIKAFIEKYDPSDLFTYQDTTGEATDVYLYSGMTLVKTNKKKQYLVAPGKTFKTGSRKEVLGMAYATRYGPDRILGTKLGEVFDLSGKRKTNKELFIEELGWHLEETSGDKLYEWINPNRTFYVYKITATDSDKYYYGVRQLKKSNASETDCLNDGYFGSGGNNKQNKFNNWKRKHRSNIQKTILKRFNKKAEAYFYEEKTIGDFYKTDLNCLNSCSGGRSGGINAWDESNLTRKANCPIHGYSFFTGDKCRNCIVDDFISVKFCEIHGETKHLGAACGKCVSQNKNKIQNCSTHGDTMFQGNKCYKCISEESISIMPCPVHGETKHRGGTCLKCVSTPIKKICSIHGEAFFRGDLCVKCKNTAMNTLSECAIHGETPFRGDKCYKCWAAKSVSEDFCEIHGEVKFRKGKCCKCAYSEKNEVVMDECVIHGQAKHFKGTCYRCRAEKSTHTRLHLITPDQNCVYCEKSL